VTTENEKTKRKEVEAEVEPHHVTAPRQNAAPHWTAAPTTAPPLSQLPMEARGLEQKNEEAAGGVARRRRPDRPRRTSFSGPTAASAVAVAPCTVAEDTTVERRHRRPEMAPTPAPPVKRKRGRPKKVQLAPEHRGGCLHHPRDDSCPSPLHTNEVPEAMVDTAPNVAAATAKRGPGRPRKDGNCVSRHPPPLLRDGGGAHDLLFTKKRGPGRPKRVREEETPTRSAVENVRGAATRGEGTASHDGSWPCACQAKGEAVTEQVVLPRRGPGRPRKD